MDPLHASKGPQITKHGCEGCIVTVDRPLGSLCLAADTPPAPAAVQVRCSCRRRLRAFHDANGLSQMRLTWMSTHAAVLAAYASSAHPPNAGFPAAGVRRLRDEEPAVGVCVLWHLHVPGVQRQAPRPGRAHQLCAVRARGSPRRGGIASSACTSGRGPGGPTVGAQPRSRAPALAPVLMAAGLHHGQAGHSPFSSPPPVLRPAR